MIDAMLNDPDCAIAMAAPSPAPCAGPESFEIRVHESLASLDILRPAWEELLNQIPTASTFSTWEWLAPWWRAYGGDQRLYALSFHDSDGRLAGLALLSIGLRRIAGAATLRVIRLMGDGSGDSDNLDLPARPGSEEQVVSALLDHLERSAALWDVAELNTLPPDSPAGAALSSELNRRGWAHSLGFQPGIVIDLPESWEEYRKRLSYNERQQLGKYLRRLQRKYEVQFRKCEREEDLDECLAHLMRLHEARWAREGQEGSFASRARRAFYADVSSLLMKRNWLEFWLVYLNGEAVGAEFNFRYRETMYSLQCGIDPAHWQDRPGYVLRGHVLEQCIASGIRMYDFLGGAGGYKERWAGRERNYIDIHFARPRSRGSVYLRMLYVKGRLRRLFPRWLWAGLWRAKQALRSNETG